MRPDIHLLLLIAAAWSVSPLAAATPAAPPEDLTGHVLFHQKISGWEGGFSAFCTAPTCRFGDSVAPVGDLDGDGRVELVVGTPRIASQTNDEGAVWVLFLHPGGTVAGQVRIDESSGGFTGNLPSGHRFGQSLARAGDLDGDGVEDLAVGGRGVGTVWILFLQPDGTVRAHQQIDPFNGGFTGEIEQLDFFARGLASVGDLDGDGIGDLAVGAPGDDDGGTDRGAVWILFLQADGTVREHTKISQTEGNFGGALADGDGFGTGITAVGDLNGDGTVDLAVGAPGDDDDSADEGAVWVLFLTPGGVVRAEQKINDLEGAFTGVLFPGVGFGTSLTSPGDLDCDGTPDLLVGAPRDFPGHGGVFLGLGAVWVLFMDTTGTVAYHAKIDGTGSGGFSGELLDGDEFGGALATLGDLDRDGNPEVVVGAPGDDDSFGGATWTLFLDGEGCYVTELFRDGFESGGTGRWSAVVP